MSLLYGPLGRVTSNVEESGVERRLTGALDYSQAWYYRL